MLGLYTYIIHAILQTTQQLIREHIFSIIIVAMIFENGSMENAAIAADYDVTEMSLLDSAMLVLKQPYSVLQLILGLIAIVLNIISLLTLRYVRGRNRAHFQLISIV